MRNVSLINNEINRNILCINSRKLMTTESGYIASRIQGDLRVEANEMSYILTRQSDLIKM